MSQPVLPPNERQLALQYADWVYELLVALRAAETEEQIDDIAEQYTLLYDRIRKWYRRSVWPHFEAAFLAASSERDEAYTKAREAVDAIEGELYPGPEWEFGYDDFVFSATWDDELPMDEVMGEFVTELRSLSRPFKLRASDKRKLQRYAAELERRAAMVRSILGQQ